MKIENLVVRSKRWTSCFLFRANTCKTGFELNVALLRVTFFLQRHWRRTVWLVLTRKCHFLDQSKTSFLWACTRRWKTSWNQIRLEDYPAINFAWGKLSFQDKMTGGFSGKKLFVGGLPPKVDEKALRDVFSRFWHIEEGLSVRSPRIETYERCHWSQLSISQYYSALVYSGLCIVGENDKFILYSILEKQYFNLFIHSQLSWMAYF